jgi:hypothetical protein
MASMTRVRCTCCCCRVVVGGDEPREQQPLTRPSLDTATQALRYMQEFVSEPWSTKTYSLKSWVSETITPHAHLLHTVRDSVQCSEASPCQAGCVIITRVSSWFVVHEAASLPRCRLGHHQTNPAIQDYWSLGQLRPAGCVQASHVSFASA